MPDYTKGKIYKLANNDDSEIYIGSTCGTLRRRKAGHRSDAKRYPTQRVYHHLNAIGWNNVRIILLQSISCSNKDELRAAEQHYIDMLHPSLNRQSAIDTCTHGREQNKCVDCNGASICQHRRQRGQCKECGGISICQHNRHRAHCKDCSPFHCDYCQTTHTTGHILQHYKTKKHKTSYVAAYIDVHDEEPTVFPFDQLIH
jgi:hypothetical protein